MVILGNIVAFIGFCIDGKHWENFPLILGVSALVLVYYGIKSYIIHKRDSKTNINIDPETWDKIIDKSNLTDEQKQSLKDARKPKNQISNKEDLYK